MFEFYLTERGDNDDGNNERQEEEDELDRDAGTRRPTE